MFQNQSSIKEKMKRTLENKGILIAAHRGTNGGNIVQNTLAAYLNAIVHGANIIEMDVARTIDGVFYCFHDGQEPLILRENKNIKTMTAEEVDSFYLINSVNHHVKEKVNRLSEVLPKLKGKDCFINIDRGWPYWAALIKELDRYDMYGQIFAKTPCEEEYFNILKESGSPLAYMPIVKTQEQLEFALSSDCNLIAVELVFDKEDNPIVAEESIQRIKDKNLFVWGNSIRLNDRKILSALHDDDNAILGDMDGTWGWMAHKGFDIIQTDWPLLMRNYFTEKN